MAWTAPMTAVANTAFTAAQFNTYVRDNLLETAPAKATVSGSLIVGNGLNSIAERIPSNQFITTAETTSSTSYTDLATTGPSITVTTGTKVLIALGAAISRTSASATGSVRMSVATSGATTLSASDASCLAKIGWVDGNESITASKVIMITGLTAGSNTFTAKYRVSSGVGTFDDRHLIVLPF